MFLDNVPENDDYKDLRLWNGLMAILHATQGLVMLFLSKESSVTIQLFLPKPDIVERSFGLVTEPWYTVNIGTTLSIFLFASASTHFLTILPVFYEWYIKNLRQEMNLMRWYEYSISSSVMIYVLSIQCGIRDGLQLMAITGLNVVMNLFGSSMERYNSLYKKFISLSNSQNKNLDEIDVKYKPDWANFIYGSFAGILPWVIISVYFFISLVRLSGLENLPENVKNVLAVNKLIFPGLFFFFNLFAINMVMQYKRLGPWEKYIFGEKMYILLSLTAKSFLAWFIWGGTLR
jgi:hypothetical protein